MIGAAIRWTLGGNHEKTQLLRQCFCGAEHRGGPCSGEPPESRGRAEAEVWQDRREAHARWTSRWAFSALHVRTGQGHHAASYELGLNYFDNAHSYWNGRSEVVYGEALADVRKEVFLTTKSVKRTRKEAEEELHKSLQRLKTDYLDLWQIHSVRSNEDLKAIFAPGGAIEAFEAAKKAGKCRFIGFTRASRSGSPSRDAAALQGLRHDPDAAQPSRSVVSEFRTEGAAGSPKAEPGHPGHEEHGQLEAAPVIRGRAMHQLRAEPSIHCLAVGCTTIGQIEDDVRIAQKFSQYSRNEMAELRERAAELAGPDLEDWKRDTRTALEGRRKNEYQGS